MYVSMDIFGHIRISIMNCPPIEEGEEREGEGEKKHKGNMICTKNYYL